MEKSLNLKEEVNKKKTQEISEFIIDMMERIDILRNSMYKEKKYK